MTDELPSTYGGPGWQPRTSDHACDVASGAFWHRCGVRSEVDRLAEVLIALPDKGALDSGTPEQNLFLRRPHATRLHRQALAIGRAYRQEQVRVRWVRAPTACANFIFLRDLYFMTPEGAILSRPASAQRAPEARYAARALARIGVPILATPRENASFEGADALWLDPETVLVGRGLRTNEAGVRFVASVLREQGVRTIPCDLPPGIQHLLGVVNFIDVDLAVVRAGKASPALLEFLRSASIEIVEYRAERCENAPFGMNFVTLAPRRILMQTGCTVLGSQLAACGVSIRTIDASEYGCAAGGLGCLTGIIARTFARNGDSQCRRHPQQ